MIVVLRSVQTQVVAMEGLSSCSCRLCSFRLRMPLVLELSFGYRPHVISICWCSFDKW